MATQDTVAQLVSAVRRVAREVPGAAEQIAEVCTGHDYSVPGKPKIDWDDPQAKDALVSARVNDANVLVAALEGRELDERAACAVTLLALVAGQDVEPAEGSDERDGRWRIARKVAGNRVIWVSDPDARHTRKSPEARRDGYRAHVAADPETGIITDEKLTGASGTKNLVSARPGLHRLKWPLAAGKSRISAAETLTAVTPVLVRTDHGMPDPATLRSALRRWAINPAHRDDDACGHPCCPMVDQAGIAAAHSAPG